MPARVAGGTIVVGTIVKSLTSANNQVVACGANGLVYGISQIGGRTARQRVKRARCWPVDSVQGKTQRNAEVPGVITAVLMLIAWPVSPVAFSAAMVAPKPPTSAAEPAAEQ